MNRITLNDAQQKLDELIAAVEKGEEYVITVDGKPVAMVTAAGEEIPQPVFGSSQGKFEMADDFDAPLDEFAEYM